MKILLTNDDGIDAVGLGVLRKVLEENGYRTFTFAPDKQMSIQSHAMTFPGPKGIKRVGDRMLAVPGTPADCVFEAFNNGLACDDVEVVISGINKGYNLSGDIILSGTYNAAMEASFFGKKAIAIAAEDGPGITETYQKAASFIVSNMEMLLSSKIGTVVNINVPERGDGIRWEMAELGVIAHKDGAHLADRQHAAFFASSARINGYRTDHSVVNDGIISVSVLFARPMADLKTMEAMDQTR